MSDEDLELDDEEDLEDDEEGIVEDDIDYKIENRTVFLGLSNML